jgi:hypothetical protein
MTGHAPRWARGRDCRRGQPANPRENPCIGKALVRNWRKAGVLAGGAA